MPTSPASDPLKFTTIAHSRHRYLGPMARARTASLIGAFDLQPRDLVLDIGCGQGTFLVEVLEASGCRGLGVDINPVFLSLIHI